MVNWLGKHSLRAKEVPTQQEKKKPSGVHNQNLQVLPLPGLQYDFLLMRTKSVFLITYD